MAYDVWQEFAARQVVRDRTLPRASVVYRTGCPSSSSSSDRNPAALYAYRRDFPSYVLFTSRPPESASYSYEWSGYGPCRVTRRAASARVGTSSRQVRPSWSV